MTSTRLTCTSGSSYKEYNVAIVPDGDGYHVNFAHGRIGAALKAGVKTKMPVPLEKAEAIAASLVASKVAKGYQIDGEASKTTLVDAPVSKEVVMSPQLSNPVSLPDLIDMLAQGHVLYGQTKVDGERRVMIREATKVRGLNRKGTEVAVNPAFSADMDKVALECGYSTLKLDCEDLGEELYVFDVLEIDGSDLRDLSFAHRAQFLRDVAAKFSQCLTAQDQQRFSFAETVVIRTEADLRSFVEGNRARGEEGVVIRTGAAAYEAGRPNSGGDVLKLKFVQDAQVIVTGLNDGKRSVRVSVVDDGQFRDVGSVTIPPNAEIPEINEIINVRYLWVIGQTGSLIQPVYHRKRTDLNHCDCGADQLVVRDESILKRAG